MSACAIVVVIAHRPGAASSSAQPLALLAQLRRRLGVDVREQLVGIDFGVFVHPLAQPFGERLGLLPGGADVLVGQRAGR